MGLCVILKLRQNGYSLQYHSSMFSGTLTPDMSNMINDDKLSSVCVLISGRRGKEVITSYEQEHSRALGYVWSCTDRVTPSDIWEYRLDDYWLLSVFDEFTYILRNPLTANFKANLWRMREACLSGSVLSFIRFILSCLPFAKARTEHD